MKRRQRTSVDTSPWATRDKTERARALRRAMTPAETVLWQHLRAHALGVKVRRQHPLAGLIADFYISSARLVIEVDGPVHDAQQDHDEDRTRAFDALGVRVLRLRNDLVERTPGVALETILAALR